VLPTGSRARRTSHTATLTSRPMPSQLHTATPPLSCTPSAPGTMMAAARIG